VTLAVISPTRSLPDAAEASADEQRRAQETEAWGAVAASTDKARKEAFLKEWPEGQHAAAAASRIAELQRRFDGRRRGVLLGAGATAALMLAVWLVPRVHLLPIFWDVTTTTLTTQAEHALTPAT